MEEAHVNVCCGGILSDPNLPLLDGCSPASTWKKKITGFFMGHALAAIAFKGLQ